LPNGKVAAPEATSSGTRHKARPAIAAGNETGRINLLAIEINSGKRIDKNKNFRLIRPAPATDRVRCNRTTQPASRIQTARPFSTSRRFTSIRQMRYSSISTPNHRIIQIT
jgi:hypothetical protein